MLVLKRVEGGDGFVAGAGFAASDEDFGAACLEEAIIFVSRCVMGVDGMYMYPDAACSPRPRDPPLTTATLPLRLKILAKS